MKHLLFFILWGLFTNFSFCQSNKSSLIFGKYEGIEMRYYKKEGEYLLEDDRKNKTFGTKTLTIDSNGSFKLEFPVPYPTTGIGLKRFASGNWTILNDTLILNGYYRNEDFIKVKERKRRINQIQIKIDYENEGKKYTPYLEISINKKNLGIKRPWTYFPLDTLKTILIEHYAGPTSTDSEWTYNVKNKKSNHFRIWLTDEIEGNNFIVENYKLLIRDSSLIQIDKIFNLKENIYRSTNLR
jgi:hypothetical protein